MSGVLVDTSVWVAFLRVGPAPTWRDALVELLDRDQAVVLDPVVAELLVGARGERERATILALAQGVRRVSLDQASWVAAGDLGRLWRSRGRTLALVDCLLAAVAARDGLALWSLDRDFAPLFEAGDVTGFAG